MPAPEPAALKAKLVTTMRAEERGGIVVVLLHGYGADGDDLLPLARALMRPNTRFIVPAAPLSLPSGGRAWWDIRAQDRPRYVTDSATAAPAASAELDAARTLVQLLLRSALERYAPEQLYIAGFSQGAMLSLDVALAATPPVQRVAVLSGALLADAASRFGHGSSPRPALFLSHGQEDPVLPFSGAQRMKAELEQHGFAVNFQSFHGGHEIPQAVVSELARFLFG